MADGIDWKYLGGVFLIPIGIGLITWGALNERVNNIKEDGIDERAHVREILATRERTELTRYTGLKESVDRLEKEVSELRGMIYKKFGSAFIEQHPFLHTADIALIDEPPIAPKTPEPLLLFEDEIGAIQARIDLLTLKEKADKLSDEEMAMLRKLELDKELWRLWQAWCDVDEERRQQCIDSHPGKQ